MYKRPLIFEKYQTYNEPMQVSDPFGIGINGLTPTHLYAPTSGKFTTRNDGTYDWVTAITDQVGSINLAQTTDAYQIKYDSVAGAFKNDKGFNTRGFYTPSSNIVLTKANGYAVFLVVDRIPLVTGVGYFGYSAATDGIYTENSAGALGAGIIYGGVATALSSSVSGRSVIAIRQDKIVEGALTVNTTGSYTFTLNQIFGRNASYAGNLSMQGKFYELQFFVDRSLTDAEFLGQINYLKTKYNAI